MGNRVEHYQLLDIEYSENGLTIRLNDEGKLIATEMMEDDSGYYTITSTLLEDMFCNSEWEEIDPEDIGALTEALVISNTAERDDNGKLLNIGAVYTDINTYQVRFWYEDAATEDGCWFIKVE
jgi:hypothetical protein